MSMLCVTITHEKINNISIPLPSSVIDTLNKTYISQSLGVVDKAIWPCSSSGNFTVKTTYKLIATKKEEEALVTSNFNWI